MISGVEVGYEDNLGAPEFNNKINYFVRILNSEFTKKIQAHKNT